MNNYELLIILNFIAKINRKIYCKSLFTIKKGPFNNRFTENFAAVYMDKHQTPINGFITKYFISNWRDINVPKIGQNSCIY